MTPKPKIGRPLKIQQSSDLDSLIQNYFNDPHCDYTMTGLAIALDMSRKQLIEYAERPAFRNVKKAKDLIERNYEQHLMSRNVAGAIFALKNMGWSDKQDVSVVGDIKVNVIKYGSKRERDRHSS